MNIGMKIKNRRLELGLTMLQLANKIGVSEATVSRWESGDIANMRRDKIVSLANALQVQPGYIMDYDDTSSNASNLERQLSGIDFALYGETKDLTDEEKQDILDYVRYKKSKR